MHHLLKVSLLEQQCITVLKDSCVSLPASLVSCEVSFFCASVFMPVRRSHLPAGCVAQLPSSEGQLGCSSPSVLQIALAAAMASLSPAALAEEVGDELGMLWPTRVLPALLRALPYLSLYTDRCTNACAACTGLLDENHCIIFPVELWHGTQAFH